MATERFVHARRLRWLPAVVAAVFAVGGLVIAPLAIDLLPPPRYVVYERAIGLSAPTDQVDASGPMPLHFALRFGWREMTEAVAAAYAALPPDEQARAGILTETFGEAGAINFLGPRMGLPHAIGTHNNYWLWGPGPYTGEVMLAVSESEAKLRTLFEQVERVQTIGCTYCMPQLRDKAVYICHRSRRPLTELWPGLKNYV